MAPAKTLYVREEDMPTWENAEALAKASRQSVSQIVTNALRAHLAGPDDIHVHIRTDEKPGADFAESGGKPILEYFRHPIHGHGWTLWTDEGHGGTDGYFIPGDPDVPPLDRAREQLKWRRQGEMEEITVEVGPRDISKTFVGRWLVEPDPDDTRTSEDGYDAGAYWGVALTKRGRIAVYTAHCNGRWPAELHDYDRLDDAELPADIQAEAAAELGENVVLRLDI